MKELGIYSVLFVAVLGHCLAAAVAYLKIHRDPSLSFKKKNDQKLAALVFPFGLFWSTRSGNKS